MIKELEAELENEANAAAYCPLGPKAHLMDIWSKFYRRYPSWFEQDQNRKLLARKLVEQKVAEVKQVKKVTRTARCQECGVKLVTLRCLQCDLEKKMKDSR